VTRKGTQWKNGLGCSHSRGMWPLERIRGVEEHGAAIANSYWKGKIGIQSEGSTLTALRKADVQSSRGRGQLPEKETKREELGEVLHSPGRYHCLTVRSANVSANGGKTENQRGRKHRVGRKKSKSPKEGRKKKGNHQGKEPKSLFCRQGG